MKKLGPLEISRSNRWAILGGVWIANFLGVRHTIPCLVYFPNWPIASGSELYVYNLFVGFAESYCGFQLPWWQLVRHVSALFARPR